MNMGDAMMLGRGRCREGDAENHCGGKRNLGIAEHFRISWLSFAALAPGMTASHLFRSFRVPPIAVGVSKIRSPGLAQPPRKLAVKFRSYASATADNVRFTPKSRHWNSVAECPLCAKSGHCRRERAAHPRCPFRCQFQTSIYPSGPTACHEYLHRPRMVCPARRCGGQSNSNTELPQCRRTCRRRNSGGRTDSVPSRTVRRAETPCRTSAGSPPSKPEFLDFGSTHRLRGTDCR